MKSWLKPLIGLFLSIIAVATFAGPAVALTGPAPMAGTWQIDDGEAGQWSGRGICGAEIDSDNQLPVTRWADGTEFHDRLKSTSPGDIAKRMQRQGIVSITFAVGNMAWSTTTGVTEMATNFCILGKVGGTIDRTAADLGDAFLDSGIVAVFVVASGAVYLWRIGRGHGGGMNTAALLQKGVIVGILVIMISGARLSTGGGTGDDPDVGYEAGFGSPGFFITTIDEVVATSANIFAGSIANESIKGAEYGPPGRARMGCAPYVGAMKALYKDRYGDDAGAKANATVPMALSSMWEMSGLEMWKVAQFGTQNIGTHSGKSYGFGDLMYCRMLERNVLARRHPFESRNDTSVSTIVANTGALERNIFGKSVKDSGSMKTGPNDKEVWHTNGKNLAWRYSTSNKIRDRFYIGWAACTAPQVDGEGNDPGAGLVHDDNATDTQLKEKCKEFFFEEDWDGGNRSGEFDWDDSDDDISQTETTEEAKDFLLTLHGSRQGGGLVSGLVYMVSSLLVMGVFLLFSGAILVAKVAALLMMLSIMFVLVFSLLPNASMSKIGDFAKQYVGLSLFAWGSALLMSLIALIMSLLVQAGNDVAPGGPGSIVSVTWVGLSPVVAVFCLHFIFKKMRIPSPLKMSGGMAWGQMAASGAVGGAAGFGAGTLASRAGRAAKRRAGAAGKRAIGNATGKVTGKDRTGRMAPSGGSSGAPTTTGPASGGSKSKPTPTTQGAQARENQEAIEAAKAEEKEAKKFAKTAGGKRAQAEAKKARKAEARAKFADGWDKFKGRPFRTSGQAIKTAALKTGKIGGVAAAGVAGTAAAVALGAATGGIGLVAAPAAVGAAMAARRHQNRRNAILNGEATNKDVEHLRAHHEQQRRQAEANRKPTIAAKPSQQGGQSQPQQGGQRQQQQGGQSQPQQGGQQQPVRGTRGTPQTNGQTHTAPAGQRKQSRGQQQEQPKPRGRQLAEEARAVRAAGRKGVSSDR